MNGSSVHSPTPQIQEEVIPCANYTACKSTAISKENPGHTSGSPSPKLGTFDQREVQEKKIKAGRELENHHRRN